MDWFATCWLVCCVVQIFYWSYWIWPLKYWGSGQESQTLPVSIIVCTNRMTKELPGLIEVLESQNYPEYEVIVVNDGPDSEVTDVLQTHENIRAVSFERTPESVPGKKAPLTLGIAHARHDWLLLTDADCHVGSNWVTAMVRCIRPGIQMVVGYGPVRKGPGFLNAFVRFDNLCIALLYLGRALKSTPYMAVGRNLLYHKALFTEADGFEGHKDVISGDDDLFVQQVAWKSNTTVCLDHESFTYTSAPGNWRILLGQRRRHLSTSTRYTPGSMVWLTLFNLSFTGFWIGIPVILDFYPFREVWIPLVGTALVQWLTFISLAPRLKQSDLRWIFPIFSLLYSLYLIVMGGLILAGPARKWNIS